MGNRILISHKMFPQTSDGITQRDRKTERRKEGECFVTVGAREKRDPG